MENKFTGVSYEEGIKIYDNNHKLETFISIYAFVSRTDRVNKISSKQTPEQLGPQ